MLHSTLLLFLFKSDYRNGHEFVDNRIIADALKEIPVENSVLVTNDVRYPAQNFVRKNNQMQLPAIFGHQSYACNLRYEVGAFSAERRKEQQMLTYKEWQHKELNRIIENRGWTHLLIHKNYPHPEDIPHEMVYENKDYAVYRLH